MNSNQHGPITVHMMTVAYPFASNCFIAERDGEAVMIDPGGDGDLLVEWIERLGVKLSAIWLTHGHVDHLGAVADVLKKYSVPVWIHEAEESWCEDPHRNGSAYFGMEIKSFKATGTWKQDDTFSALGTEWRIDHTPGHSPGCIVIASPEHEVAFSGDLILMGAIGRTDLPGSNHNDMMQSLKRYFSQDVTTALYTGHGDPSDFASEKKHNPYVREALGNH